MQWIIAGMAGRARREERRLAVQDRDAGESFVQPSSWIGSIIGAIIVLVIYLAIKRRSGGARTV